jgi:hypothetical protein
MIPKSLNNSKFELSTMFSAKYELFALFCNVHPLFSSLYELFCAKTSGVGVAWFPNTAAPKKMGTYARSYPGRAGR